MLDKWDYYRDVIKVYGLRSLVFIVVAKAANFILQLVRV